jgi:hypothetical protein
MRRACCGCRYVGPEVDGLGIFSGYSDSHPLEGISIGAMAAYADRRMLEVVIGPLRAYDLYRMLPRLRPVQLSQGEAGKRSRGGIVSPGHPCIHRAPLQAMADLTEFSPGLSQVSTILSPVSFDPVQIYPRQGGSDLTPTRPVKVTADNLLRQV